MGSNLSCILSAHPTHNRAAAAIATLEGGLDARDFHGKVRSSEALMVAVPFGAQGRTRPLAAAGTPFLDFCPSDLRVKISVEVAPQQSRARNRGLASGNRGV
jgi:hypothetical protein